MRLKLIGAMAAMATAVSVFATPNPSGAPAPVDPQPTVGTESGPGNPSPAAMPRHHGPTLYEHLVDINSASRKELMTLPGIGKDEADRIIKNRPYLVKTDLVGKNVLPVGPFLSIKYRVVAMPTAEIRAKLR